MQRFVVISGASGGGKSTLLAELKRRGQAVVEEPGRRIVREEMAGDGAALPWVDAAAFARRAVAMALDDWKAAERLEADWVFFDRGLIDAAVALQHATKELVLRALARDHRYNRRVFLAPPWPAIYAQDTERRHDFAAARDEYDRLLKLYPVLGYTVSILSKTSVEARADFVLDALKS